MSDLLDLLVGLAVFEKTESTTTISGSVSINNFPAVQPVNDNGSSITVDAVSLPLPIGAATEATLADVLTTANFQARIPTNGSKPAAQSLPVTVALDNGHLPVHAVQSGVWTITGSVQTSDQTLNTAIVTSVAASSSSVTLLSVNTNRQQAIFCNDSNSVAFLKFGITASNSSFTYRMVPNSMLELPRPVYVGRIDCIWTIPNGAMRITEVTI